MMDLTQTLKELCLCRGISGNENSVAEYAYKMMNAFGECYTDARGNFICRKKGKGKKYLLDAHMDQIGFVVTEICDNGFVKVAKVGGVDKRTLSAQEVIICASKPVYGVILAKAPHLTDKSERSKASDISDISVDTGLCGEELKKRISLGDPVIFKPHFAELISGRVTGTAIDDRSGMLIIARTLEILKESELQSDITAVFSVQEEVGGGGAANASFACEADEAFVVDVSFAEQPEISESKLRHCMKLGGGVFIGVAPVLSRKMSEKLIEIAKAQGIPFSLEVMGGKTGTNADGVAAVGCGKAVSTISPPIRNMHTAVEIADIRDIEASARLISKYISDGEMRQ